ncbi:hypothetical protein [Bradyrhizobium sp. SRS-191]|uniref:hypothetical protein n=1 Tax=Bradyrhizobium sp. SRS-191 TaxID=2962606 RepID=UPI00211E9535|nr:hypothetical protein [Bradyrhizobium sp. SRS-191]
MAPSKKARSKPTRLKPKKLKELLENLDIASLHDDDLADIMLRCASTLNFRKTLTGSAKTAAVYCYTQAPGESWVTVWQDGHPVEYRVPLAVAQQRHIPVCGG